MFALDDLPSLPPGATAALIGLALVLWCWVRVQIIRRQQARGGSLDDLPRTPGWLRRLAVWPALGAVLAVLALSLGGLLAWSLWR